MYNLGVIDTLHNAIDSIKLPFLKERELRLSLYHILGFYPHNLSLYKQALQHKSVFNHKGDSQHATTSMRLNGNRVKGNNERMEFLGDAILDATVGHIVYKHFLNKDEGFLTNTRSKLVQRETLNRLAKDIGLSCLICYGSQNESHNSYMGGNAFEALVGAIYLDRGYNACMRFLERRILQRYMDIDNVAAREVNFKSKLLEWAQKRKVQLCFTLVEEQRENRATPVFISRATIEGIDCEAGRGYSKKESQQRAAQATLQHLHHDHELVKAIMQARDNRVLAESSTPVCEDSTEMPVQSDEEGTSTLP